MPKRQNRQLRICCPSRCASKRHRVAEQEPICRVTGLARQEFLIASHIKPWRDCSNSERLSGANGLLLSPHLDKLKWAADRNDGPASGVAETHGGPW